MPLRTGGGICPRRLPTDCGYAHDAEIVGVESGYAEGSLFWIVNNIYFQPYSLFIFLVSVIVMFVVSYVTEKPSEELLRNLTFSTMTEDQKIE